MTAAASRAAPTVPLEPWPNGQGTVLLRRRLSRALRVRIAPVPLLCALLVSCRPTYPATYPQLRAYCGLATIRLMTGYPLAAVQDSARAHHVRVLITSDSIHCSAVVR